ncbi:HFL123Cp [Eremothecium sinecaudum]|uniref:HFL123Cp n=1 Tax=Eremothecium sinecaudum TaxID=45286 RepID=A0A109UZM1_9SACH|nr:HFL123Cp [Eremothecium sinecaudum]AMD21733.1 HFL123Cp [Eremothecium sinecaudum]
MNSIFGAQTSNPPGNRFTNLSVNFPQQQQTASQQQNTVLQPQNGQQGLLGAQGQYNQNESNPPSWFHNPRKRTIPQTIIKRSSKPTTSEGATSTSSSGNSSSAPNSGFGLISFGSKKSTIFNSRSTTQGTDVLTSGNLIDSNEAPPMKSLYDLQREDEFGSVMPASNESNKKSLALGKTKETTSMRNVFDRDVQQQENQEEQANSAAATNHNESAVLVFGYPESISNQIILHFSKFGNILEEFEVLRGVSGMNNAILRAAHSQNLENHKKYPIFTGDGWIKLTYDSPSSALRALQENGTVYGGSLIGCVPYNKQAVEQLASCRIEKSDDIGGVNFSVNQTPNNNLPSSSSNNESQQIPPPHDEDHARFTFSTRKLDLKDGASLFVHSGNSHNHNFLKNLEDRMRQHEAQVQANTGIVNKINSWLFGWNDL